MLTIKLMGPDKVESSVNISDETTVRDVVTSKFHLFWRTVKRNGVGVVAFTTRVMDGDLVTLERK